MHKILCGRRLYNVVFSTPRVGILQEDGGAVAGVFSTLTSIVLGKPRLAMHIAHCTFKNRQIRQRATIGWRILRDQPIGKVILCHDTCSFWWAEKYTSYYWLRDLKWPTIRKGSSVSAIGGRKNIRACRVLKHFFVHDLVRLTLYKSDLNIFSASAHPECGQQQQQPQEREQQQQ